MDKSRLENWICETDGLAELTAENLRSLQFRKANELLAREKLREGFYQNLPDHVDSWAEWEELPFTTPEDLSENAARMMLLSQAEVSRVITGKTSGTTGPSKRIFYTQRDLDHTVGFFAAGIGEMAGPGDKVLIEMPFSGPFGLGDLIEKAVIRLGAIPVRGEMFGTWEERAALLAREQPETCIAMPVPLLGLIRYTEKRYGSCSIKKALLSADACPDGVMRALETRGISLFPHYGSREMCLGGAITCPAHEGTHLRENHILAEIVDENGRVVPDGEWGELVITTLDMEAFPVIRYRTGDRTRFFADPCSCGCAARRIDKVSRVSPDAFSMEELDSLLFSRFPELLDMKAELTDRLSLTLLTLPGVAQPGSKVLEAAKNVLPFPAEITTCSASGSETPFYPGKRFITKAE